MTENENIKAVNQSVRSQLGHCTAARYLWTFLWASWPYHGDDSWGAAQTLEWRERATLCILSFQIERENVADSYLFKINENITLLKARKGQEVLNASMSSSFPNPPPSHLLLPYMKRRTARGYIFYSLQVSFNSLERIPDDFIICLSLTTAAKLKHLDNLLNWSIRWLPVQVIFQL